MTDEERLRELETLNRQLLEANTALRRNLAKFEMLTVGAWRQILIFFACAIALFVVLSLYPLTLSYAQKVFNPTKVPKDYDLVNKYVLEHAGKNAKVFWLPNFQQGFKYTWAPEKRVGPFNILSANPSVGNFQTPFRVDSYINWIEGLWRPGFLPYVEIVNKDIMLKKDLASRLLVPFSARYVIVDSSVPGYDFVTPLSSDTSLKLVFTSGKLSVFETSGGLKSLWPALTTLKVRNYWDHLAIVQKLAPELLKGVSFADGEDSVGKKYGQLDIDAYKGDNLIPNPSFEKGYGLIPFLGWRQSVTDFPYTISPDSSTKVSGKVSLKVENSAQQKYKIGWVLSDEIPAAGDSVYTFESNMKYQNVSWTQISLEGYVQATGQWKTLIHCPNIVAGTRDWQKYYLSFYLPQGITKMRVQLSGGWVNDPAKGSAISWFDDIKLNRISDQLYADIAAAKQSSDLVEGFEEITATKFRAHVINNGGAFVITFGESFSPPWVAVLSDGTRIKPVKLYSTICGFPIDRKGRFDVVIEYEPEGWFHVGFAVAMFVLALCLVYLIWSWRRHRVAATGGSRVDAGAVLRRGTAGVAAWKKSVSSFAGRSRPGAARPERTGPDRKTGERSRRSGKQKRTPKIKEGSPGGAGLKERIGKAFTRVRDFLVKHSGMRT